MAANKTRARPPLAWHEGALRYFIAGVVVLGLLVAGSQILAGNSAALKDRGACEKACTDAGNRCRDNCQVLKTAGRGACEKGCETQTNTCKASCKTDRPVPFCSDSDGGANILTPGICTDSRGTYSDYCVMFTGSDPNIPITVYDPLHVTEFMCYEGYCSAVMTQCPMYPLNKTDLNTLYQSKCSNNACVIPNMSDMPTTP